MADAVRRLAKRAEIIAKATLDYHAGRISSAEWRKVLHDLRPMR
jgi:hypothetical protein